MDVPKEMAKIGALSKPFVCFAWGNLLLISVPRFPQTSNITACPDVFQLIPLLQMFMISI
jgi:hypothetical protein